MTDFRSTSIVIEIAQRLFVVLSLLVIVFLGGVNIEAMKMVCDLTAKSAAVLMRWTGVDAVSSGNLIRINHHSLSVDSECSAVFTMGALAVLMSVVPVSLLRISTGILLGTFLIVLGNVMRIAFLGHLIKFPSAFGMWHLSILPVLQVILSFCVWWIWFQQSTKNNPRFLMKGESPLEFGLRLGGRPGKVRG